MRHGLCDSQFWLSRLCSTAWRACSLNQHRTLRTPTAKCRRRGACRPGRQGRRCGHCKGGVAAFSHRTACSNGGKLRSTAGATCRLLVNSICRKAMSDDRIVRVAHPVVVFPDRRVDLDTAEAVYHRQVAVSVRLRAREDDLTFRNFVMVLGFHNHRGELNGSGAEITTPYGSVVARSFCEG